jgi:hypothetical protein
VPSEEFSPGGTRNAVVLLTSRHVLPSRSSARKRLLFALRSGSPPDTQEDTEGVLPPRQTRPKLRRAASRTPARHRPRHTPVVAALEPLPHWPPPQTRRSTHTPKPDSDSRHHPRSGHQKLPECIQRSTARVSSQRHRSVSIPTLYHTPYYTARHILTYICTHTHTLARHLLHSKTRANPEHRANPERLAQRLLASRTSDRREPCATERSRSSSGGSADAAAAPQGD